MNDPYDLQRFVTAQEPVYAAALEELRAGKKRTHWMWFVFPQLRGLGASPMAHTYGIASIAEARAYLAHNILGPRLHDSVEAVLTHAGNTDLRTIFGQPDDLKFVSSMTLFERAATDAGPFTQALTAFNNGRRDQQTLRALSP